MGIFLFIDKIKEYFILFLKLFTFFLLFYELIDYHIKFLVIFVTGVIGIKRLVCFKETSLHIDFRFVVKIREGTFCKISVPIFNFGTSAGFVINMY